MLVRFAKGHGKASFFIPFLKMGGRNSKRSSCCGESGSAGPLSPPQKATMDDGYVSDNNNDHSNKANGLVASSKPTVFVTDRFSSCFIDEDGDTADEFYEEIPARASKNRGPSLIQITRKLKPKGYVPYCIPRLNPDLPFIMYELGDGLDIFSLKFPVK